MARFWWQSTSKSAMTILVISLLSFRPQWVETKSSTESYAEALKVLDNLLRNYDKRILPKPKLVPVSKVPDTERSIKNVKVEVNMYIRSFTEVDEINHDYTLQITLRQKWSDNRLAYGKGLSREHKNNVKVVTLNTDDFGKSIWMPDTFLRNSKEAKFHEVMKANNYIRISPDGDVTYSERITAKLGCPMDHRLLPMGKQKCNLVLASYAYPKDEVEYVWRNQDPLQVTQHLKLAQYTMEKYSTDYADATTAGGKYSSVAANFHFSRDASYDITTVYVPLLMLVITSWLPFWIDPHGVNNVTRFLVSFGCLIFTSYSAARAQAKMPIVTYTKAIDVWTGVCVTFQFFAFIHCVIVHYLTRFDRCLQSNEKGNNDKSNNVSCGQKCFPMTWYGRLDVVARIIFPVAFVVFAISYSTYYAGQIQEMET